MKIRTYSHNKTQKLIGKVCPICKNTFEDFENNPKKICSQECKRKYNNKKSLERYYKIIKPKNERNKPIKKKIYLNCKECGKIFERKTKKHIFCNKECCTEYNKLIFFEDLDTLKSSKYKAFLKVRFEIFKRDNFQCQYCGRNPKQDKCKLQIDHIIPRIKGGTNEINNFITSCEECNLGKKDILLEERQIKKRVINNEI